MARKQRSRDAPTAACNQGPPERSNAHVLASVWAWPSVAEAHENAVSFGWVELAVFSFLYFLKIKILKIYVRFEIFEKYPPVAPHRATGLKCNFFLNSQ